MPVVGTRTRTRSTTSTSRTTATGSTARTTRSTATGATQAQAPSARGRVAPPLHHVAGMGGKSFNASNTVPSAGTTGQGVSSVGTRQAGGGYTRGKIDVDSAPYDANSFLLTVKTHHASSYYGARKKDDDKMTLVLQCRVQDGTSEGILNLSFLKDKEPCNNKSAYEGEHTFRISYDEVNKLLQSYKPGLKLVPGANLAVAALWDTGHCWGGYNRGGVFEVPSPPATTSPIGTRTQTVSATRRKSSAAGLPLDVEHKMPASVKNAAPAGIFGTEVKVSSRLETELKGELHSAEELEYAIVRLYQMANDPTAADKALGKGWSISPVTHWWQQTPAGNVKKSARMKQYLDADTLVKAGLAKNKTEATHLATLLKGVQMGDPLPLEDKYSGTADELKASIIQRIRSNKIAEGVFNLKPGPGVLLGDISATAKKKPSGLIRKRIEYGYTLKSKNVDRKKLEDWLRAEMSPYNPAGEALRTLMPNGAQGKHVAFVMNQERHRFTLKHQGGLEIDVSVDFVNVKHPVTGKLETKYMVEMEIDHQYINAPGSSSRSSSTAARPTNLQSFSTESEQKRWASGLTGAAQLNGLPRFHELPDLQDKAIWQTPEQKETEKAIDKLFPILFPSGASPSQQKGVAMATTLKLI